MTPEEKAKWWLENERLSVKQNQKWLTQALREARAEGMAIGNGLAEVLDHAIETEQFTPGGSTESWAKDELSNFRALSGEDSNAT